MKILNTNYSIPRNITMRAIRAFRKAYKVPMPKMIESKTEEIIYKWNKDGLGKDCFLIMAMRRDGWKCIVSDNLQVAQSFNTNDELVEYSSDEDEIVLAIIECLDLWIKEFLPI